VRVAQRGRGACLLQETPPAVGVCDEFGREDLQRDVAVEADVVGTVHHPHAAAADLVGDAEVRQGLADHDLSGTGAAG
jgi:hypothetical protein